MKQNRDKKVKFFFKTKEARFFQISYGTKKETKSMSLTRAFTIFSSRTGILQLFLRASENT
jgi:hypothetical protein